MKNEKKVYFPNRVEAWIFQLLFMFIAPLIISFLSFKIIIDDIENFDVMMVAIMIMFLLGSMVGLRFMTTKYIIDGNKFKFHRLFGLVKTEAYLKDVYWWSIFLYGISMVQLRQCNGKCKSITVSLRQKQEAELVKLIMDQNPDMQISYSHYKMVKKHFGIDYSKNIINGTYPIFFK